MWGLDRLSQHMRLLCEHNKCHACVFLTERIEDLDRQLSLIANFCSTGHMLAVSSTFRSVHPDALSSASERYLGPGALWLAANCNTRRFETLAGFHNSSLIHPSLPPLTMATSLRGSESSRLAACMQANFRSGLPEERCGGG